ncbi:MAG: box helicase domain protein [Anaerocolumna sp.]|nr:box helicase domain protein [Anaerocolumna sp.]
MELHNFEQFNLQPEIIKTLEFLKYNKPTNIQQLVLPQALAGKDLWVRSQTGSGKTAAFGIPICERIDWLPNHPQALVLVPTRELALQVAEELGNIGKLKRLKALPIFGKVSMERQELELKQKTHMIVGTPGRVRDLITKGTLPVDAISHLIIDEADEMFHIGLKEQVEDIIKLIPKNRITMLFSATLNDDIRSLTKTYMIDPIEITIQEETIPIENITQLSYPVEEQDKLELLRKVTIYYKPSSCIIFANTQEKVEMITKYLTRMHYPCFCLHGAMRQKDRIHVMNEFRLGAFGYLIATDVAARGIDINDVSLVINFDISRGNENYVHRIGRCGRLGSSGLAITFFTTKEQSVMERIMDYTGITIPVNDPNNLIVTKTDMDTHEMNLNKPIILKEKKGKELNQTITKLHIYAGKKDKIRTNEIVATICGIDGVTAEDIGIIQILKDATQVEILNHKGNLVLDGIKEKTIKGKVRKVRKCTR